jgi:hypothetical protein
VRRLLLRVVRHQQRRRSRVSRSQSLSSKVQLRQKRLQKIHQPLSL